MSFKQIMYEKMSGAPSFTHDLSYSSITLLQQVTHAILPTALSTCCVVCRWGTETSYWANLRNYLPMIIKWMIKAGFQHEQYPWISALTILILLQIKDRFHYYKWKLIEAWDYMLVEDMLYIRLNLVFSLNLWLLVPVYVVLSICDNLKPSVSHGLIFWMCGPQMAALL